MIFGYNTDVKSGDVVYHVQTEDRGEKNPVIDSVIYVKGRIVDRRRTPYQPGQVTAEQLQDMVKQQHRQLVDAIRGGTYVIPAGEPAAAPQPATAKAAPSPPPPKVEVVPRVELTNAGSIERDGRLVFRLQVRDRSSGKALPGSVVRAVIEPGEPREARREVAASEEGVAEISFGVPASEGEVVLFQAVAGGASETVKFRLLLREEE